MIQWLDQLARWDDQIDLQRTVAPLGEVARWTRDPSTGSAAIGLLRLIAAPPAAHKTDVVRALQKVIKNRAADEVRSAAVDALASLREQQPAPPGTHSTNGKARGKNTR